MILQIDDWKFDIDMERTMEYSANEAKDHCTCAYCRNFYTAVDDTFPQLRPFLAQFGLSIEAPDEMVPVFFEDGSILYDPEYRVYGKILQHGCLEMEAGSCNIVARNSNEQDYFLISCYEVLLRWQLDEPWDAVISPANDPSLMERAIAKLLGDASNSDLSS